MVSRLKKKKAKKVVVGDEFISSPLYPLKKLKLKEYDANFNKHITNIVNLSIQ